MSWRAEIQWHEASRAPCGLEGWEGCARPRCSRGARFDDRTRTVTATVTLETPSLLDALHHAVGMTGDESWVGRIVPEALSRQLLALT